MAKKRVTKSSTDTSKNIDADFYAAAAAACGGSILKGMHKDKYFIDTGNLALNYICSGKFIHGGIPAGITEVFGPPASSKSLLAYTILGAAQRMGGYAVLMDTERAANETFAVQAGHVNEDELIVCIPRYIEEVESKIKSIVSFIRKTKDVSIPIVFALDSISVLPCHREYKELDLPENYTQAEYKKIVGGKEQPGERAKAAGGLLRKINGYLSDNNASMFVINQTRDSIGVMWGSPEVTAGGGKALPFYANCRLRTSAHKPIIHTKREIPVGVMLKFANKKSRSFVPFLSTDNVPLYFSNGIDSIGGLLSMLMAADRVILKTAGNYIVKPEYSGTGEEVPFKASKTENKMSIDVILENPKLIDAESREEVERYLSTYDSAIQVANDLDVRAIDDESSDIDTEMLERLGIAQDEEL